MPGSFDEQQPLGSTERVENPLRMIGCRLAVVVAVNQ
jgi:hypothetical protein